MRQPEPGVAADLAHQWQRHGQNPWPQGTEMQDWRSQRQLSLLIDNIPSNWMIAELKSFLDGFGTVVKVEIFEDPGVSAMGHRG